MTTKTIFITGGAGYIGSHTCVLLCQAGVDLVVFDDLSNASIQAIKRVESITSKQISFVQGDIRDEQALVAAMAGCDAVIHFAGLKAVGESVEKPALYYDVNVNGTLCLLRAMAQVGIESLVFSSSATVYGDPETLPLTETHRLAPTNPYGRTKWMIEEICRDACVADGALKVALLRYFNPVGAHDSGLIGEDPSGIPNNLMPFISQVAVGKRDALSVFGDDYDTPDGTGVRDYIHVMDLADGHVKALAYLDQPGCEVFNLGTGTGVSVLEVVKAYEKACGKNIEIKRCPRRAGDVAQCYADASKAKTVLGWEARYGLDVMCEDSWRWQEMNPEGYC